MGGKFLDGESPFDCAIREAKEETGLTLKNPLLRGIVTFVSNRYGTEYMFVFTCNEFDGELDYNCDEGILKWIDIMKMLIWLA